MLPVVVAGRLSFLTEGAAERQTAGSEGEGEEPEGTEVAEVGAGSEDAAEPWCFLLDLTRPVRYAARRLAGCSAPISPSWIFARG